MGGDVVVTVVCALNLPNHLWKTKLIRNGAHLFTARSVDYRGGRTTFDQESFTIHINNPVEPLRLEVWEANRFMPDRYYGTAEVPLVGLEPFNAVFAETVVVTAPQQRQGLLVSLLSSAAQSSTPSRSNGAAAAGPAPSLSLTLELVSGNFGFAHSEGLPDDVCWADACGGVDNPACRIVPVEMTPQQVRLRRSAAAVRCRDVGSDEELALATTTTKSGRLDALSHPTVSCLVTGEHTVRFEVDVAKYAAYDDGQLFRLRCDAARDGDYETAAAMTQLLRLRGRSALASPLSMVPFESSPTKRHRTGDRMHETNDDRAEDGPSHSEHTGHLRLNDSFARPVRCSLPSPPRLHAKGGSQPSDPAMPCCPAAARRGDDDLSGSSNITPIPPPTRSPPPPPTRSPPPPPTRSTPPPPTQSPPPPPTRSPPPPPLCPGNARGAPPPPPPPAVKRSASSAESGGTTRCVFWSVLPPNTVAASLNTVWSATDPALVPTPLHREALNLLFGKRPAAVSAAPCCDRKQIPVPSLIDAQREKRIGIVLQFLRMPIHRIREAIMTLDDELLSEDVLDSLLSIYPTADEEAAVRRYLERAAIPPSVGPWATPLQFIAMCASDAKLQTRLQVWLCAARFHRSADEVYQAANAAGYAAQCVLQSESLRAFFHLLLSVGNHLNAASATLRNAKGIVYSDWSKAVMTSVSGSVVGTAPHAQGAYSSRLSHVRNLFEFTALIFSELSPASHADLFSDQPSTVRRALLDGCKVDVAVLQAEVRELAAHLEACRTYACGPSGRDDETLKPIREFIPAAEVRLASLGDVVEGAADAVTRVAAYFVHPNGNSIGSGAEILSTLAAMCGVGASLVTAKENCSKLN